MKKFLFLLGALLSIAYGSYAVTTQYDSKASENASAAEATDLSFVRKITVYQSDFQGGILSFQMDLVRNTSTGEFGLSSGPVRHLGYLEAWNISPNPDFRRTNEWYGRYTHYSKISGIASYFNL